MDGAAGRGDAGSGPAGGESRWEQAEAGGVTTHERRDRERESQGLRGNPWISTVRSKDGWLMATEAVAGPVGGIGPSCIFFLFSFDNK